MKGIASIMNYLLVRNPFSESWIREHGIFLFVMLLALSLKMDFRKLRSFLYRSMSNLSHNVM